MITITNIMHVNGSKADLYSSKYFKKVEGVREAVSPFARWTGGSIIAFGTRSNSLGVTNVAIDLRYVNKNIVTLDIIPLDIEDDPVSYMSKILTDNEVLLNDFDNVFVPNPTIPSSKSYTSWKYKYEVVNTTSSYAIVGDWFKHDFVTKKYLNGNMCIDPVVSTDTVAQRNKSYYYVNKWDFNFGRTVTDEDMVKVVVSIDTKEGDDLSTIKQAIVSDIFTRLRKSIEESDVELLEVDITKASVIDTDTESVPEIMGYWLGKLKSFVDFKSVDQSFDIVASFGSYLEPNMEGDFEYRRNLHDAVFQFKDGAKDISNVLPICNGLACYPRIINKKIYACEGQRLSYNEQDRNRRWVLADFANVGGASFIQMSKLRGSVSELELINFDPSKQSVMISVRGRLFVPEEFDIVDNGNSHRILFDVTKYTGICELDRMVCRGDFKRNSKILDRSHSAITESVVFRGDSVTASCYVKTTDKKFVEGKSYFVLVRDDFYPCEVPVGQDIGAGKFVRNTDLKSEASNKFNFLYSDDGDLIFDTFYEFKDISVKSRELHVSTTVKNKCPSIDLKNDPNSFVIVINKPGLRIIRHRCFEGPRPFTKMNNGHDAPTGTMRVSFDRQVRGLLFDESTRSVVDYTRETQSLTFYADKFRRWGIANVSSNWSSLMAVTDETADNSMSTKGYIVDVCDDDKYNHIVWPHLTILDFVFKD